jgi:hypothetical protein
MNRRTIVLAVGLAVVFSGVAEAQSFVSTFHIIPVVAKIKGGAGTDWVSDVSLSNVSDGVADVQTIFFPEATNNSFPFFGKASATYDFTLQAGQTLIVNDVIATWFPGQGDSTKGVLLVLGEVSGDEARLAVATRTYNNADPSKTYGQGIGSGLLNVVWGSGRSVLTGVRHDSRYRSNIGVVNITPLTLTVLIDIYDASGNLVRQQSKSIETFSSRQYSLSSLGVNSLAVGRVEVYVDPATITWDPCNAPVPGMEEFQFGAFISYLSKVDGGSGDAEFSLGLSDWAQYVDDCGEDPVECR